MKKLIAMLAVLALAVGLVACGGQTTTTTAGAAATDAPAVTTAGEEKTEAAEETKAEATEAEVTKAAEETEAAAETEAAEATEAANDAGDGEKVRIMMITDTGGVNDQSFNQSAWEGLQRAETELGVEIAYLESRMDSDYLQHLETAVNDNYDLIWGVGFKMADAVKTVAEAYPDQKFAIVDSAYDPQIPNVTGVLFKANECSYLVGYIAGKMSESGKVGHVNGMDTPTMNEFAAGFYAGVLKAKPDAEILGQYANSFGDVAGGKAIANQMYKDGVDIIYAAAGDTGNGVIESAKENDKFAIGVDRDQNYMAPDNVITSAMKEVGNGMFNVIKDLVDGKEIGGTTVVYGLDSGAVGIAPTSDKHVSAELLKEVEDLKQEIIDGKITVPMNAEELVKEFPDVQFMK